MESRTREGGNIAKTVQSSKFITTDHEYEMTYGLSNRVISHDIE